MTLDETINSCNSKMKKAFDVFLQELGTLRTGRANASMLERFFDMMTDDLLKKLHKDGFLKIEKDKDGELELITIAEVEDLARKSVQLKEVEEET